MNSLRTLFFLLLLAVPAMASAQSAPAAARPSGSPPPAAEPVLPAWDQLSPEQRDALVAPLRERWNDSPQERARMLEHARRWKSLPRRNASAPTRACAASMTWIRSSAGRRARSSCTPAE